VRSPEPVVLEVPARAEYVRLVRLLVASLAASRPELDEDRADDLRLAVSEACALAVEAAGDRRMTITCREEADGLVVELRDGTVDRDVDGLAYELIRALVDEVVTGVDVLRLRMTWAS
jgi:anti-sigma regulatory factor (Ser/Thr protein kinase)